MARRVWTEAGGAMAPCEKLDAALAQLVPYTGQEVFLKVRSGLWTGPERGEVGIGTRERSESDPYGHFLVSS